MTDLILDFAADAAAAPEELARLNLEQPRTIAGRDLRRVGPWHALRELRARRVGTCVTLVSELRRPGPWWSILVLSLLVPARRRLLMDRHGTTVPLSRRAALLVELPFVLRRARTTRRVCAAVRGGLDSVRPAPAAARRLEAIRDVVFVRPDLGPALRAGGSLAHIQGVVSGFVGSDCAVELFTPAEVSGVEALGARVSVVPADPSLDLSVELPPLAYNATLLPRLLARLERGADLLYQRHSLGCFAGAVAAQRAGVPLVVEYNGPEVWIARNWGAARRHLELFHEIERRTLLASQLVVAVSGALRVPLRALGVPDERILINPNGVDHARFAPEANRDRRRRHREALGVGEDDVVVGFVGTFGPWHGAELLARAICLLPRRSHRRLHFVFVGDGPRRPETERILRAAGRGECATFTGMVDFDETPGWLAAFDACVSPHVPNADGSPFFGSPTKLFEYLAASKPVIASDLGQIGEILEHGTTAWLVPPADPGALARAIDTLAGDAELRQRLGHAARQHAVSRHGWRAHVERILDRVSTGRKVAT